MLIESIHIKNFRCIEDHTVSLDNITSFIGPNGAGKSTVLRALNWVFNGTKESLGTQDVSGTCKDTDPSISVTVKFKDLTTKDREVLTPRYARVGTNSFALKRSWSLNGGDRLEGAAAGFPAFTAVRKLLDGPAEPAKAAYATLRAELEIQGILLEPAKSKVAMDTALSKWEADHTDQLVPIFVSDTQMFGFAGQGELSKIFTYVFVDADLRANDEAEDSNKTILGRILARALDRSDAEKALAELADDVTRQHDKINNEHLGPRLKEISEKLSEQIAKFTPGRSLNLRPQGSLYTPPKARVDVSVTDRDIETRLENQGHGFQRAALVACLQVLAEYARDVDNDSVMFLAIEEPELFQHPNQARAFASVLRQLSDESPETLQIAYATHSLYFINPFHFQEVRRVTRDADSRFVIGSTNRSDIADAISPHMSASWDINSEWSKLILLDLGEALFADAVVLCEGADDAAILDGASRHDGAFDVLGITATSVRGKTSLFLPHAVLKAFGIPTLVVWDNDSNVDVRAAAKKQEKLKRSGDNRELTEQELDEIQKMKEHDAARFNRKLAEYMGVNGSDYPVGQLGDYLFAVDDTLETMLANDWPELFITRERLLSKGEGYDSPKHEATYRLAAERCHSAPSGALKEILGSARALISSTAKRSEV